MAVLTSSIAVRLWQAFVISTKPSRIRGGIEWSSASAPPIVTGERQAPNGDADPRVAIVNGIDMGTAKHLLTTLE